jgi:hypothetical protein
MALRIFFFLLCISFGKNSFSQFYIRGHVTDSENQLPLKGASVYINNTTKGTTTDDNGNFQLGPFSPGQYEVVASYVGYEALLYSSEVKTADFRIRFKLNKKELILREVLVLSSATRKQYLDLFKKYVLGVTVAADHCKVENLEDIQFTLGDTKDEILAFSEKELVIENPDLGYTLYFELVDFYHNKLTSGSYFFGYTRYVDWAKDEQAKRKWLKKRRQAYMGSTVHFFRSLVKKELTKEGFTVYHLDKSQRLKKDTLVAETPLQKTNAGMHVPMKAIEDSMIRLYPDSSFLIYELRLMDGWRIIYKNSTHLKTEIQRKSFMMQPSTGTMTGLRLREAPVLITGRGMLLTPIRVYYDGIWAYERLANMLPEDYEAE